MVVATWIEGITHRPRKLFILATLVAVVVVGFIDYITGSEFSFSVFYLLAIGVAVWFVGAPFAFFVSILSVAVSLAGDLAAGERYSSHFVPWWNASIVLAFYFIVVWLLARLHDLYEEMEVRVRQRTISLTNEMAERERLEKELLEVSEREQQRIGHDLHDSLGQHLTGTALASQVLKEKLTLRGIPEATDASRIVELIEDGISLLRKISKGLHPIEMEADGLMQALEELAANSRLMFKISCCFECESPLLIRDASTAGHLYRIAQEAVSNAVKHGKARNIKIQLETLEDGMALHISDDGIGLPDSFSESTGMGLRIMAHRASIIGGTLTARHEESGGTTVSCLIRLKSNRKNGPDE